MELRRTSDTGASVSTLVRLAVSPNGRRHPGQAVLDEASLAALPGDTMVVLDHAGPAASRWATERAVAVDEVVDPASGRRARALDDQEWATLVDAFAAAARRVRAAGHAVVVAVDGDGLLHAALSPLQSPSRPERVLEVLAACAPCTPLLTIEDLAPGGLDASAGVAFAVAAIEAAKAPMLIATGGTAWLLPLLERRKGRSVDQTGLALASAGWCVGRVAVPVVGVVRDDVDVDVALAAARRLGLAGVVFEPGSLPNGR
jgi:hypothetical protein